MEIVVHSSGRKGPLDDDYTLFDNGDILHEYDKHIYPGGQNLKSMLRVKDLSDVIKQRLLNDASDNKKVLVCQLLEMFK
ncbi:hypothetical protein D3C72_544770 [compost metagenome]